MTTQQLIAGYEAVWKADVENASQRVWAKLEQQRAYLADVVHNGRRALSVNFPFDGLCRHNRLVIKNPNNQIKFLEHVAAHIAKTHPGCEAEVENDESSTPVVSIYLMRADE